jgi:HAD superfamily hydrolase (TIGR01509 family)
MKQIRAVAFDCDGVLFDTEQANRIYYGRILQHFGRPAMTDEQFTFVHMNTVYESLAYLFPDQKALEAAHVFRKSMDYRQFLRYLKMEPHLFSLLEKLRPHTKTAIATNRTDTMDRLLTEFNLDGWFDLVVTCSDVEHPKPQPDALLKILDHFKFEAHQVIYVGDSRVDEQAAKAAGMPLVAYRNPDLASDYHINDLKELEELLNL